MGPSAIRYAGIEATLADAGVDCEDVGDLDVPSVAEFHTSGEPLEQTRAVCQRLSDRLLAETGPDRIPIVLGGDHSISIGSLGAIAADRSVGVVWFDAHGDYNTPETSPSGNVHGMSLAAALGAGSFADQSWSRATGVDPHQVSLVGTRDLDRGEAAALRESDIGVWTMSDIDAEGIGAVTERAIERASDGVDAVYVSLDLDFIDPLEAPGVGTPVHGGVTYREAHLAMEQIGRLLYEDNRLAGMDVMEVNPIRDRENQTAELATELVASAFGDRIL